MEIPKPPSPVAKLLLTPSRLERLSDRADKKIKTLTLVLDRVHDLGNISACIRSAESFGLMEVHIVLPQRFKIHRNVARATDYWVKLHRHKSVSDLLAHLEPEGFTFVSAMPSERSMPFSNLPLPKRLALVMGGEGHGVSYELMQVCKQSVTIPMYGFCESLNVSTSTAILLQHFSAAYREKHLEAALLNPSEREALLREWVDRDIKYKTRDQLGEASSVPPPAFPDDPLDITTPAELLAKRAAE